MDPDCERSGLKRQKIMEVLAFYDDLLQKRRRNAMQTTLDRFFKKKSSEASTTSDKPQPGIWVCKCALSRVTSDCAARIKTGKNKCS